jgi:hypothetical protein
MRGENERIKRESEARLQRKREKVRHPSHAMRTRPLNVWPRTVERGRRIRLVPLHHPTRWAPSTHPVRHARSCAGTDCTGEWSPTRPGGSVASNHLHQWSGLLHTGSMDEGEPGQRFSPANFSTGRSVRRSQQQCSHRPPASPPLLYAVLSFVGGWLGRLSPTSASAGREVGNQHTHRQKGPPHLRANPLCASRVMAGEFTLTAETPANSSVGCFSTRGVSSTIQPDSAAAARGQLTVTPRRGRQARWCHKSNPNPNPNTSCRNAAPVSLPPCA